MDEDKRRDHITFLWRRAIVKSIASAKILNVFGDLNRIIYLYGSSKKHEFIEKQE
jgi:hypothetical protein